MQSGNINKEQILSVLNTIPDPEIPVVSIVELGMVKDVLIQNNDIRVQIMPTYTACPATRQIQSDIEKKLKENNISAKVEIVYSPAWTTDRISPQALEKLNAYGIAPPQNRISLIELQSGEYKITCPRCGSTDTVLVSPYGSTPCKALMKCHSCKETFDYFKCHL
ncbi:MAG: phenylacetate-CoA oxygenase subunit PaaJ [Bacteroidetes bacterium]|nr:MAG: phenylacetate-CoA oxygenase subunit PaaJ [Bacteroidota bacterium]